MAKKRKRRWTWLRYRKGDVEHNVHVAMQRWIHANGGIAIVTGGIGVMDQGGGRFKVCFGVVGKPPTKETK